MVMKFRLTKYLLGILCIFYIENANAESIKFTDYVNKLAEHPQVTQILEQSSHFKNLSDGEMGLPNPQLIFGVDNLPVSNPTFDKFLPTSKIFGFKQQIPSYSLREARAEKQRKLSERQDIAAKYKISRLESVLVAQIMELDKVQALEDIASAQITLYKAMEEDLSGQLEAGKAVYGRFSEIDLERAEIELQLNNLKSERVEIEQSLIHLVGEVPDVTLPSVPDVMWHKDGGEDLYPVVIAKENMEIAEREILVANSAFNPDYGVQAIYKQRESGAGFSGDDWFSVQATISIPLWHEWNQKPKLNAARAMRNSTEFNYEDVKREWLKKMLSLESKRDMTLKNIMLLISKKEALSEMIKAARRNYEAGNIPLIDMIDVQINELKIASQLAIQRSRHIILSAQYNSHIIGGKNEKY